jgi:EAL domain-containing protein (putative c-di-GMP-specific phosphodiesterase class I)
MTKRRNNTMDSNVEKVITQLRTREEEGLRKYGVNTERTDLTSLEWLQHLQEELMDASVYIEKLKNEIKENEK